MNRKIPAKKFCDGLLRDIFSMLNDANDHDVIIYVGDNQNIKEFRAHSNILKARSKYFRKELSVKWTTKKNMIEFKKPNINPDVFAIILRYIYTGKMQLTNQSGEDVLGLIVASNELIFHELFNYLQDYMIKYQSPWIQQNLVPVLQTASKISDCAKLRGHCIQLILEDPQMFITSKDFLSLDEDILFELLKRDDLQIEEIIIWDYLIKWCIETTGLGSDRTKWNSKNYEELKEKLDKFISLIRFSEISSADFFCKVQPFMKIIPDHIYVEVLKFYMKGAFSEGITTLPPRAGIIDIDSKIIKPKHAYIIANWIDNKDEKAVRKKNDLKYEFKLIYRSDWYGLKVNVINGLRNRSKDCRCPCLILVSQKQNTNNTFQQESRNVISQEKTSQNFKKIYGEYNSFALQNESFIFSFENEDDIKNMKISRNSGIFRFSDSDVQDIQNVYVGMLDYCNGNVGWKDEVIVLKRVEIFEINKYH